MDRWVEVAREAEVPQGTGRTVRAGDLLLALFNEGGRFYAIDDRCPHQGASLGDGALHDGRVICPLHSWIFQVDTGQCPRGSHAGVRTYPTRRVGDVVEVQLTDPASGSEDGNVGQADEEQR